MARSTKGFLLPRKTTLLVAIAVVLSLGLITIAVARGLRLRAQSKSTPKDALVEQIERSPGFPLKIKQDDDTPLRILDARVKVVSAADYERLTSERSAIPEVISAPEVSVVNVSTKTISRIMLVVNDVSASKSQGIVVRHLSLAPGATYRIVGSNFVKKETITTSDQNGNPTTLAKPSMRSKGYWLPFADKSQVEVRIGVEFQDGTVWFNRNERSPRNGDSSSLN